MTRWYLPSSTVSSVMKVSSFTSRAVEVGFWGFVGLKNPSGMLNWASQTPASGAKSLGKAFLRNPSWVWKNHWSSEHPTKTGRFQSFWPFFAQLQILRKVRLWDQKNMWGKKVLMKTLHLFDSAMLRVITPFFRILIRSPKLPNSEMRKTSGMCGGKQGLGTLTNKMQIRVKIRGETQNPFLLVYSCGVCFGTLDFLLSICWLLCISRPLKQLDPSIDDKKNFLDFVDIISFDSYFPPKVPDLSVESVSPLQPLRHPTKYWQSSIKSTLPKPHQGPVRGKNTDKLIIWVALQKLGCLPPKSSICS